MPKLVLQEDIKEGMVLALPVKNKFGQMLMTADTRVEDKHKKIFKVWGIEVIYIKEDGNEVQDFEYNEKDISEATTVLDKRLQWTPKNFNEEDLYKMALQQILENNF